MGVVNSSPGLASIQFLTGPLAGRTVQLTESTVTIGRDPSNTIEIADPSISRHHVRLVHTAGQWRIEKLAAQNFMTVNQRDVQQTLIRDRDTIGLGATTTFRFLATASAQVQPPPVSIPPIAPQPPFPVPLQVPLAVGANPSSQTERALPYGGTAHGVANAVSMASLEISSNIHPAKQIYLLDKPTITIGRHPSNTIEINESIMSSYHLQIVRKGNQFELIHPSPANPSQPRTLNGLLYNGRHINGDEPFRKPLVRGDIFRIGDEHGSWVTLAFNDGSGAVQEVLPEIRPITLGAPVITIGRLNDNTVMLGHPQVSGHHARLEQVTGKAGQSSYRIVDLKSTNHVYVNGQKVTSQVLARDDEVRIGPFKLTYTGRELIRQDESKSIRIDATDLGKVGNRKTILINDITLVIPPRKFVALVGGSGAGKSTLLDALNGLRPAQKGHVYYNGQDYYQNLAAFSTQLGYVPQDDIIHRDLTVERALYYAAKLRLPNDFTQMQITQRIDEVLEDVEMKHRRKSLISKLSGGQRKRVSIALELLANPSVFFLDEPTSGLDPGLDRKMMFLLRKLADKGHTIVLVTHATNNINACDYVCFLAQGGRLAYYGPPDDAKAFFGKTDFAEIYSVLEPTEDDPNIPEAAESRFKASPDYQKYVAQPAGGRPIAVAIGQQPTVGIKQPKRGNPTKQFSLLARRYIELLKNDVGNLLILLLQAPIIGLILIYMAAPNVFNPSSVATCPLPPQVQNVTGNSSDCQNVLDSLQAQGDDKEKALKDLQRFIIPGSGSNAQEILFIMSFAAVMFGSINAAREIVKEAPIYRRERTVNLGIMPYMFSKIAVLGTLCLLQSLVLVALVNSKAPFHQGILLPPFLEVYITMALTSLAGLMLGLTVSALVPNNDRAMSFIPIVLIPQVIFSGVVFPLNDVGTQILGSFFAVRWSMTALGSTIGLHADKLGAQNDPLSYRGTLFSTYTQPEAFGYLLLMWLILIVMIVLLAGAVAFFLKRKDVRV